MFILYLVMAFVFGTVVAVSYVAYGMEIKPNLFMSLGDSWYSYTAISLMAAHLVIGFLIIANPLAQQLEIIFNTPQESKFNQLI